MHQTMFFSCPQWEGMNLHSVRIAGLCLGVWEGSTEGTRIVDVEVSQDFQGIHMAMERARLHSQESVLLVLEWNAGARRNAWAQLSPLMPDPLALALVAGMASATVIPCEGGFSRVLVITRETPPDSTMVLARMGSQYAPWQVWPVYALLVSQSGDTGGVD